VANPFSVSASAVDPIFQFFQIRHQAIERRRFGEEHFPHVPIVASNPTNLVVWRAYPKASGFGQIIPRRSLAEKDFLMLHYACQQSEVRYRTVPVLVPVQTGEIVIVPRIPGLHLPRVESRMEQRRFLPEGSFRSQNVDFRSRLSEKAGECVSNVRLNRLALRGPYVPSASKLQPNDRANVVAQSVQVLFQAERVREQEALPICIGWIFADLPIRLPEDQTKGLLDLVSDSPMNSLRAPGGQLIQFATSLVCARDVGRVLLAGESEGVSVENDVNIFREALCHDIVREPC
jgi:hypothetical protein